MNLLKNDLYSTKKFATVLLIQILCGMEMDLFIPSLPELQQVFHLSTTLVQMTLSVNFITFCIGALCVGILGDRFNSRVIILIGLCLFVVGSVFCVVTTHFAILVLGRALQGIGISAPAILSFPVILEDYSVSKQPSVMGMMNGVKTFSMAIAPLLGSYVNLYFNWHGNFGVLLAIGSVALLASYFYIPSKTGDPSVSLSLDAYLPLLQSKKFLTFSLSISFLTGAYWIFMGMAPLLYVKSMGVSLKHFGYYQGALSLTFALVCLLSPEIYRLIGEKRSLFLGIVICFISAILILMLSLLKVANPFLITIVLAIFSVGIVFPINILYPFMLQILPQSSRRAAGLGQSLLLMLTAVLLEFVAYCYKGQLMPIGLTLVLCIMLSLFLIQRMIAKKWV